MKVERECREGHPRTTKAGPLSTRASSIVAHHAHGTDSVAPVAQVSPRATGASPSSKHSIDSRCCSPYIPAVSDPTYLPKFERNLSISNSELTMRRASASRGSNAQRGICSALSNRELLGLEHAATY